MQKELLPKAEQYAKQNKRKSIWRKFVRAMACVVVFCTTYALILPAITMERPLCELEEHTHSDSCYVKLTSREVTQLACDYDTLEVHEHGPECLDADGKLVCGLADYVVHEHDASCRDANGALVCVLPEIKEHEHTEECYQAEEVEEHVHDETCYTIRLGELVCELTETEGHTHTDECKTRGDLVCGQDESEGHAHGEACGETILVCDLTVEPHVHGDSCWTQLVCELIEDENHTHSEECSGVVLNCDLTEQPHVHGDGCYQTNLLCDLPESAGHSHDDSCYAVAYTCGLEESEGHSHEDSCYEQVEELTCQPEETEPTEPTEPELICEEAVIKLHTHDEDDCYEIYLDENGEEQKRLICEEIVVEEHVHSEACFVTEEVPLENVEELTCTLEETGGHDHNESCYDEAGMLICTLQTEAHTHTDRCYGTWERICGKEEHAHNEICSSESEATKASMAEEKTDPADSTDPSGPVGYAYREAAPMKFSAPRIEGAVNYHTDIAPMLSGIQIIDSKNQVVYDSANPNSGTNSVLLGEKCKVILSFKETQSDQFETNGDGTLTYQIPSNLSSDIVETGTILNRENQTVANYTINNNELILTPVLIDGKNFFGEYNDVTLELEFNAEVIPSSDSDHTEIQFDNNHTVNIEIVEDGRLEAEKKELAYDPVTRTITYECTATAYGGTMNLKYIDDWWWPNKVTVVQDSIQLKDAAGNDVTDKWTYVPGEDGQYFSLTPQMPVSLKHGESVTLTYQVKVNEDVDENFEFVNEFAVRDIDAPDKTYDKATVTTYVTFTNVKKSGAYYSEVLNDTALDALEWTVEIDNSDLNEITITDKLGPGQTFCKHKPIYIRGIRTDGTREEFSVEWVNVECNEENNQFTLTLPTGPLADGKYEFVDYKLVYYSHYTLEENGPDIQYFGNTVETNILIGDKPTTGTASVGVLGVPPGIRKEVTASDDQWLTFTVECFMPAGLNNRTSILLYDTLASWGNINGYIEQDPDSLMVTISPEGGTAYALQPFVDQESTDNTYLLVPDGQSFTMFFNTSQAEAATSTWKCDVNSTLIISYRISLDAPMLDSWGGDPNGEKLRSFLERTGQKVNNEAKLNYSPTDSINSAVSWSPPKEPEPTLTKSAKATHADGVYDYSVWFNTGDTQSSIFKKTTYESDGEQKEKNDILSLNLTDTFDSRMEYVPGSLKVLLRNAWDHEQIVQVYQLADGEAPTFTTDGDTTTMVISAADLIGIQDEPAWLNSRSLLYGMEYLTVGYQYEFVYQLQVKEDVKLSSTEGVLELDNTASITWTDGAGSQTVGPADNRISYDTGILQKDMIPLENNNLVQFSILVNHNVLDLAPESDTYVLYDTMSSNLALLYNTLSVQVLDENGEIKGVLTPADCHFSYNPDENKITLNLPDECVIRITYNCAVHGIGGETVDVQNTVEIMGRSLVQSVVNMEFAIREHQGSADASSEAFYLQKQDGNNHNALAGVTFHLYGSVQPDASHVRPDNVDGSVVIDNKELYYYESFTTQENGIVHIQDSQLTAGYLYALVEESPPAGYVALEEPYLFYMEERPLGGSMEIPCVINGEFVVIENFPQGYELPKTGGAGTTYYAMGGLLIMMAAILLYSHSQKRKKGENPSF